MGLKEQRERKTPNKKKKPRFFIDRWGKGNEHREGGEKRGGALFTKVKQYDQGPGIGKKERGGTAGNIGSVLIHTHNMKVEQGEKKVKKGKKGNEKTYLITALERKGGGGKRGKFGTLRGHLHAESGYS